MSNFIPKGTIGRVIYCPVGGVPVEDTQFMYTTKDLTFSDIGDVSKFSYSIFSVVPGCSLERQHGIVLEYAIKYFNFSTVIHTLYLSQTRITDDDPYWYLMVKK